MVAGLEVQEAEVRRYQASLRATYSKAIECSQVAFEANSHLISAKWQVEDRVLRGIEAGDIVGSNDPKRQAAARDMYPEMYAILASSQKAKDLADHRLAQCKLHLESFRAELRVLEILYGQPTWQREQ